MKKALITGASGFMGQHLFKELDSNGYEVYATARTAELGYIKMNMLDYEEVHSVIRKVRPTHIFHLAGIAFVPTSWKDPRLVFRVNLLGSLNLFEAIRSTEISPVVQIAGSSEEYGLVHENEVPVNESNPLRPLSPYAVSKIAMDFLAYQYFKSYGMKIIRTRAFNHEGYGRGEQYMPSTFAKQIVEIEKGLKEPVIKHGNLTAKRDITDVRDVARAYRMAVEGCEPGEVYNIGSGQVYSAADILEALIKLSTFKGQITLEQDPARMRPSDVKILHCDSTKFREKTGWKPKFPIDKTLSEALRYWREYV